MKRIFTLSLFLSLAITLLGQPTVVSIKPSAEGKNALLVSSSPDLARPDFAEFGVNAWTNGGVPLYFRSLIEFDLSAIPAEANIVEATLNLYYAPGGTGEHANTMGSNESLLMRVTESWDKTTVTWNNQPTTTSDNQVLIPNSINPTQDYLGIDVSQLIRDAKQLGNYGFLLKLATEQHYRRLTFASGDYADDTKHPELIVKYTTEAGTPPAEVTNLTGVEATPLNIELSWADNATNEANYIIERSIENPTSFQPVATLAANTTTATVTDGISNKTRYFFRVKAVDANGYYSYSETVSVITGGVAINDGDKTVCNTYHFDSGVNNPYRSVEDFTQTLTPATANRILKFTLNSLNLTAGDVLSIYDGSSTSATKLYDLTYSNIPSDPIVATNAEGKLTLRFTSDTDVSKAAGWEAYITCELPMYAPHNIALTQTSASTIEITWADTISNETGFEIQRSVNGSGYTTIATTAADATSYTDNDILYSGSNYTYQIRTRTAYGASAWSNAASIVTLGPVAPSDLLATSPNATSIVLTWADNSTNEEKFVIERSTTPVTADFVAVAEVPANTTSYTNEGLTTDVVYYFRVKAVNGEYNSNYSNSANTLTGAITMNTSSQSICGLYVLDPGGTSDYQNNLDKTLILTPSETSKMVKLTFDLFNTESNNDLLYIYDGPSTSSPLIATLTGLKTTPFAYNATNAEGTLTLRFTSSNYTTRSGFKAAVTCVSIPNAPSNVNLVSATEHTIKIGWTDNSADETKFQILYATAIDGTYLLAGEVNPDVTEFEHTGLVSKTTYFYKVRAVSDDLTSAYSPAFETSTEGIAAPTITSISSSAPQTITINWEDNDINETGFVIERSLEPSANYSQVGTVEADVTTFDDNTVEYGVIYYYRVYAVNDITQSELSASVSFMAGSVITSNTEVVRCNYILLDPGGINNYSNNENKTIVLSPTEPDKKVNLNFEEFRLESGWDKLIVYNGSSTSAPQLASLTGSTIPADITATNAEGKLTLKFTSDGSNTYSGYKINVSCIIPIAAPTNLIATSTTSNSTTISWTDNSDSETKFEIYRANAIDGEYTKVSEVAENVVEYTDTDLASGTTYFYKVIAANSMFFSVYSNILEITTTGMAIPVISNISSPTNTSITLSWDYNSTSGTGFVIQRSLNSNSGFESLITLGISETSYTDNNVEYNTAYYYRLFATSNEGNSDTTDVVGLIAGAVVFDEISVTRCNYKILDPGGLNNYPVSYDKAMVIYPSEAGKMVSIRVDELDLGSNDYISIYNGITTSTTNIGQLWGTSIPSNAFQATNTEGALTLLFYSNSSTVASGFKLDVSCVTPSELPSNLTVLTSTPNTITIGWTDNSNDETIFKIYRSQTLNGNYAYVGEVDANITQYTDANLNSETTYYYKIQVVNLLAMSSLTEALEASTIGIASVSNLRSSSPTSTSIVLTWTDNSTTETSYSIERSTSAGSGYESIATIAADATSYTDNSVIADQTYYYKVFGLKDEEKALSSPITGTIAGAVTFSNATITNCNYTILDPGNLMDYSNLLDNTMVLIPSEAGKVMKITFNEFITESGWDYLYIYDGPNTSSTLLERISGVVQTPFSYTATNAEGVLTLRFTSDGSVVTTGFKATASCISIPNAPSNLNVVSATTNSITLGWTDNSTDETKFQVYCAASVDGEYNLVGEVSADVTQFTHNGLASGTTYFYQVFAANDDANSLPSNAIEAKTGGIAAPTLVSLASPDNQTITINWQRNDVSETGFVIERSLEANANFAELTTVASDATSYSDNAVTFGTTYYYRIYAVNATEESDKSETSYFVAGAVLMSSTEVNRCNYIIFDSGNSLGNYSNNEDYTMLLTPQTAESAVKLTFESFATETDNDILYVYDGASTSDPLIATLSGNQVPSPIHATNPTGQLTLRFISNGSNNQAGFKIAANCINQVAAPTDLAVQSATGSSITVFWRDNTDYELGYKVYRASTSDGDFVEIGSVAQNVNTFTDENLTTGTTYYYIVKAWNNDYVSNPSNTLEATTLGALAPTSLTAHAEGSSDLILDWTDNATTESGYIVERSLSATSGFEQRATLPANFTSYIDFGSVGTTYYYQVKAIADGIESAPSNVASVKAGYVSIFDGSSRGCDYYLLDPGGEANYSSNEDKTIILNPMAPDQKVKLVFHSFDLENNFDHLYIFDGPTVNDPLIATLTGTTLPDSIWASNTSGSLTLQFVSDGTNTREGFFAHVSCIYIPEEPTNLTLVSATNSSIEMRWTTNDLVRSEFVVYRSLTENGTYEPIAHLPRFTYSYTDDNLELGTQYFYKVYTSFYGHHSVNSANLAAATAGCRAPSELAVESTTENNAELTWVDNSFNETGFTIERSLQATDGFEVVGTASANATAYTDTNLESEQTYYYRVKATTDTEQSEYTSVVSVVVGAQIINDAEIVRCNYTILDNGGLNNYIDNKTTWATLTPSEAGKTIKLRVSEFSIEANKDYLALYNGGSAQSPMVGAYTGTAIPDTLWATNTDGKLHLRLSADATNNASGFRIYVGCVDKLAAPTNLVQAVVTKAEVNLQWTDNSQNEIGFKVYRSVVSNTGYTEIASLEANANGYVDSNTENGKTYYYKVLAYNKEITSGYSNTLTVVAGPNAIPNDAFFGEFTLYPNPTSDISKMSFSSESMGEVKVEIYTIIGNLVSSHVFAKQSNVFAENIDVNKLQPGFYLLKVTLNGKTLTVKLHKN